MVPWRFFDGTTVERSTQLPNPSNKPLTYYSAETGEDIPISDEFLDLLRNDFDAGTKTAAVQWAAQGGAQTPNSNDEAALVGDSYLGDGSADASLDQQVIAPLTQFDGFRAKFVGKPTTPELQAFLNAAQNHVQPLLSQREALQYRKNAMKWLRTRAIADANSDQSVTSALVPPLPQPPAPKYPVNDTTKNNDNFQRLLPYARKWAGSFGLPIEFVMSIIEKETSFRPWLANSLAFSRGGAYGVMQMTLLTARGGGTAVGLGFTGYPDFTPSVSMGVTRRQSIDGRVIQAGSVQKPFPSGGQDIISKIPQFQAAWQGGDDTMGLPTSHLMNPDTNMQLGCALLAQLYNAAGQDIFKTAFNYNGDKNLIDTTRTIGGKTVAEIYGDRIPETREVYANVVANILVPKNAAKLSAAAKTPLSDQEKVAALQQVKQNNGGRGLDRQLKSFIAPILASYS